MRIHLPGLPHTETTADWCTCAFTHKIGLLARMLTSHGHHVILYAGERNDAICGEHVTVATDADRARWFGTETYQDRVFDRWQLDDLCWTEYNDAVIAAMRPRVEPGDLLALPMGLAHRQTANAFPALRHFESGVGYEGVFADFRVFESSAWQHWLYGRDGIADGRFYDTVIPNAFDPADFTYRDRKDDYLLFLGRHTPRKGLEVVAEIAKHHRVLTAGQGELRVEGAEYVGVVRGVERAELIARARALLAPTLYVEPFGGVAVEAQLSGTPAITTPWGAFAETVEHGVTGFHCHTLGQFLAAIDNTSALAPRVIRDRAVARYALPVVAGQYDDYLALLATLDGPGWYTEDAA